jgi:hypothetical protein
MKQNLNEQVSRIKFMMEFLDEQIRLDKLRNCRNKEHGVGILGPDKSSGEGGVDTSHTGTDFAEISSFSSYDGDEQNKITALYNRDKLNLPGDVQPPNKRNKKDYYTAAYRESERFNRKNSNKEYTKYFDASGNFKNPDDRSLFIGPDIYFPFYKHYFPNKLTITPLDVINLYKDKLGGLDKFINIASTGYRIQ